MYVHVYKVKYTYVTRYAKINHASTQKSPLLCHNSRYSYGNKIKFTPLMQKFMENLIKFTE